MDLYIVTIGGVEHTVQLSEEDAKRYGDAVSKVDTKAAAAPANKSRTAKNKA